MVQQLLPEIGFGWSVRALGLVVAVLGISAAIVLRTRVPPRKTGPLVEWAAFKEPPFALFSIAMFLNFWGVYFPFIYVSNTLHDRQCHHRPNIYRSAHTPATFSTPATRYPYHCYSV